MAGNLIGFFGGWGLGEALSAAHHSDHIASGSPLGAGIGSIYGSALGVYFAGNSRKARGKLSSAVGGSMLGIVAAVAVSAPLIGLESGVGIKVGLAALAIFPPVGAAIFFNRSIVSRPLPAGNALLNLFEGKLGLGVPDIHLRPLFVPGLQAKSAMQFCVKVLRVEL